MASEDNLGGGRGEDTTKVIMSTYEQSRERRIRENLERMRKMGIVDITQKLRMSSGGVRKRGRRTSSSVAARLGSEGGTGSGGGARQLTPLRRSSRLRNATPVTYSDVLLSGRASRRPKSDKMITAVANEHIQLGEGPKPEVYTEEYEKLLGGTEKRWELFADGYGKDGRRIYDPFKGKTCHQCRQKTLGHRTKCSQCSMVQGQFCGDCLYMRYGEHVLEALENPKWICPVCRGICNCSLCRQAKGWAPTGPLYRKLKSESIPDSPIHLSAKRSLLFSNSGSEEFQENNMEIKRVHVDSTKDKNSGLNTGRVARMINRPLRFMLDGRNTVVKEAPDDQIGAKEHNEDQHFVGANSSISKNLGQAKNSGSCSEPNQECIGGLRLRENNSCLLLDGNNAKTEQNLDYRRGNKEQNEDHSIVMPEFSTAMNSLKEVKKHGSCQPNLDSITGRLWRRKKSLLLSSDDSNAKTEQIPDCHRSMEEQKEGRHIVVAAITADASCLKQMEDHGSGSELNQDSIGRRLRLRKRSPLLFSDHNIKTERVLDYRRENEVQIEGHRVVVAAICADANNLDRMKYRLKYRGSCSKPNQDSMGGRLRLRKKSLRLLSDDSNSETVQAQDYQGGNREHNKDHHIVVAAITAASNGMGGTLPLRDYLIGSKEQNGDHRTVVAAITADSSSMGGTLPSRDYLIGSKEQNEDHRIVVAAIRAAEKSSRPVKWEPCRELNDDNIGGRLRLRRRQ